MFMLPARWFATWAILWPPPGCLRVLATMFYILSLHGFIFLWLFFKCARFRLLEMKQQILKWSFKDLLSIAKLNFSSWQYLCSRLLHSFKNNQSQPQVYSTYALTSKDIDMKNNTISWNTETIDAVIDNSANTHIWSRLDDYVEGSLHYFDDSDDTASVLTIGDDSSRPVGVGTVKVKIRDDTSDQFKDMILEKALYFPNSPVNVISVTHLALQFKDPDGTWIKTKMNSSEFAWDFEQYRAQFHHPSSHLPVIQVYPFENAETESQFYNLFCQADVEIVPSAMSTCFTNLPSDNVNDICLLCEATEPVEPLRVPNASELQTIFCKGDKVRLTRNGTNERVMVQDVRHDEETMVPYFRVQMEDGHEMEVTKDFLFPLDAEDLVQIPITRTQVVAQLENLTPEALEALLNPPEQTELLKEFMAWHVRLGHLRFASMFRLCKVGVLPNKFAALEGSKLICPHCVFGNAKRRQWRQSKKNGSIRSPKDTLPGDATSIDHIISAQPGLVPRMDSKHTKDRITAGCVFFDHVTNHSYTHLQTSADNEQTIEAKRAYERYALTHGVTLKRFHADNGIFAEKAFRDEIDQSNQKITYCAVGAHHQNGLVERHIGTLTKGARINLLYAQRKWPEAIGTILWPFAWKDFERKYNHLSFDDNGLAPINKFTNAEVAPNLRDYHPFGCPVFVLDSRLQSGGVKIPKWDPRARVGVYLGHSPCHAGSVALVLNPKSLIVSPQFHLVFDDEFSTVPYMKNGEVPPHWKDLVEHSAEIVSDEEFDLATTWANEYLNNSSSAVTENEEDRSKLLLNHHPDAVESEKETPITTDEEDEEGPVATPIPEALDENVTDPLLFPTLPDLNSLTCRRSTRRRVEPDRFGYFAKQVYSVFVAGLLMTATIANACQEMSPRTMVQRACLHVEKINTHFDGTINSFHYAFSSMASAGDNDVYTLKEMLKQEDKNDFIQAMVKEVDDHTTREHWDVVPRSDASWYQNYPVSVGIQEKDIPRRKTPETQSKIKCPWWYTCLVSILGKIRSGCKRDQCSYSHGIVGDTRLRNSVNRFRPSFSSS